MRIELLQRPDYGMARVELSSGESLVAESGAMVARDVAIEMKTSLGGGLLAAAKRKLLGGETLFVNTFTSRADRQSLWVAPATEGDVVEHVLNGAEPLFIHSRAFLAAPPSITLDTKWGGLRGVFGAGLFLVKASGSGSVLLSAYGGIHPIDIDSQRDGGYVVDNGHIVAFTSGLDYQVRKLAGLKGLFLSGEGLVCHFTGRGRLWLQTRNPANLAAWVHPFRRVQPRSGSDD